MPPLAIYIHWPFCKSKCPYCDFNSHVRDSVDQDRWRNALLTELAYMAKHTQNRMVSSIFFGGGTPSLMPAKTAGAFIEAVCRLWPVTDDLEVTCEANPTSVEANTFADFKAAGVNRVSLGVQSLDDKELKFLGRGHSAKEALLAIELAAKTFPRYSFDLIYARPGQTQAAWEAELKHAMRYIGGHMSLYQLTIEENTAFAHAYKKGEFALPDEETSERLYTMTGELLAEKGLVAYEVSNYAKPGDESRHNLAYWQGDDYIGVGPGAHGRVSILKETGKTRIATQTLKSPERWLENVEKNGHALEVWQEIAEADDAAERLMMGLRLSDGIGYEAFMQKTGYDLRRYIHPKTLALYTAQGLLEDAPEKLKTTLRGRLLLNRLTAELLL